MLSFNAALKPSHHQRLRFSATVISPNARGFTQPSTSGSLLELLQKVVAHSCQARMIDLPQTTELSDSPQYILVMRHAEKPVDMNISDLALAGHARAEALAEYIPRTFGVPDAIFAAALSKHSERSLQTVMPLSKVTGVLIDATIADEDYAVLASKVLSDVKLRGARVVICWHHGRIPALMNALGAVPGSYPDPWGQEVFNLILRVEFVDSYAQVAHIVEPF